MAEVELDPLVAYEFAEPVPVASLRERCEPLRGLWLLVGTAAGWLLTALPLPWVGGAAVVVGLGVWLARSPGSRAAIGLGLVLELGSGLLWEPVPAPSDQVGRFEVVVEGRSGAKTLCRITAAPDPALVGRRVRCPLANGGDTLAGTATLHAWRAATNPGGFDARSWGASAGTEGALRWKTDDSVTRRAGSRSVGDRVRSAVVAAVAHGLKRLEPASAALWTATLLARNDALPTSVLETFRQSGLFHMLSVSGFHMAVLGGGLVLGLSLLHVGKRPAWILAAVVVVAYAWLLEFPPPVTRSMLAFVALALAMSLGRRAHAGNALGIAAAVCIWLDPNALFQMGAQLTFLATAALLWMTPAWLELVPLRWRQGRLYQWVAVPMAASLAATAATAPVLAYQVGAVAWIGIPAGLVSAAAFAAGFLAALATVVLGALPAWCSWGFAGAAEGCARLVYQVALWSGQWQPGCVVVGRPGSVVLIGSLAILVLFAATARPQAASRAWVALAGVALVLVGYALVPKPAALRLVFLDVGQGSATLVSWPSGAHWLVDAGPVSLFGGRRDAGRDVIYPALRQLGIARLDAVVISHPDLDHYGGLGWLSQRLPPAHLLVALDSGTPRSEGFDSLARQMVAQGWQVQKLAAGQVLGYGDGARCEVIAPGFGHSVPRNQACLVLRMGFDSAHALLAGDADSVSESFQIGSQLPLRSQVLAVGHHGSRHSSSLAWLRLVAPRAAILSYGRDNRYGHPHQEVLERLARLGATPWTGLEGAVWVELGGGGAIVSHAESTMWRGPWRRRDLSLHDPWI